MIIGIGTDIVYIARFEASLEKFGTALAGKILAPQEQPHYQQTKTPAQFLAKRFAAKEAFAKALGTGVRGFWFTDIAIVHDDLGKPGIQTLGRCKQLVDRQKCTHIHLSISDEKDIAQAFVVLEG